MAAPKFKPQFQRLQFIDREIRAGSMPSCATMAKTWECNAKTIQRDIDYLKDVFDAPIEYDVKKHGLYYANKTWFLPSVMMSEGDLFALLVGSQAMAMFQGTPVADELKKIYTKLAESMPDKVSVAPEYIFTKFSFHTAPARAIRPEVWKQVVRGVHHQNVLEILYKSSRYDKPLRHTIHPYHLANIEGEWYVLAKSVKWDDMVQYVLGRIQKAEVKEQRFEIPADFDAGEALKKRFGRFLHGDGGKTVMVRLLFDPKLATYISEKMWHPKQELHQRRDKSLELQLPVYDVQDIFPWVMGFGSDVKVLGPKELRDMVKRRAERVWRMY